MGPTALRFLRRVSVGAFALAILVAVVPWVLTELGFLGPTPREEVEAAQRVVDAARAYGAPESEPSLGAAVEALERARSFAASGNRRKTRRAALDARARGIEAQRVALASREDVRRRARTVVDGVDSLLNDLEDLYAEAAVGKQREEVADLLSLMKNARQSGASLFLAYEQGDYARVTEGEKAATDTLLGARAILRAKRPTH